MSRSTFKNFLTATVFTATTLLGCNSEKKYVDKKGTYIDSEYFQINAKQDSAARVIIYANDSLQMTGTKTFSALPLRENEDQAGPRTDAKHPRRFGVYHPMMLIGKIILPSYLDEFKEWDENRKMVVEGDTFHTSAHIKQKIRSLPVRTVD